MPTQAKVGSVMDVVYVELCSYAVRWNLSRSFRAHTDRHSRLSHLWGDNNGQEMAISEFQVVAGAFLRLQPCLCGWAHRIYHAERI